MHCPLAPRKIIHLRVARVLLEAAAMMNVPASHQEPSPPPPPYPNPSLPVHAADPVAPRDQAQIARMKTAAFAMLGAAALVVIAMITKSWFTAGHDGYVGVLGVERCHGFVCQSQTWFDVKHVPTQVPLFASCALIAGLLVIAFMVHTAVVLLQGTPHKIKLRWLTQTLGLATLGAACFVFSLSVGDWSKGLSIGWSSFVGFAGLVAAGVVTAAMVRPLARNA